MMMETDDVIASSGKEVMEAGGLPMFDTRKAQLVSSTMRELQPIGADDAERWVAYWIRAGF